MVRLHAGLQGWIVAAALLSSSGSAQDSAAAPSAISLPSSQYWDGIDGPWSTFGTQIGTPAQQVRVLPMTQQGAVWTILPDGCTENDPTTCGEDRGGLFLTERTSWTQLGLYGLNLLAENSLGYSGNGLFGQDAVTLGWPGDNLPGVESAVVAGIATKNFYMGGLPLNPWPVNFTTLTQSEPSLMTQLKNQSIIPSLSYGYTAGFYNNNPSVAGSLTLGGYDASRFVANNVNFTMGPDITYDLQVSIQAIETGTTSLLVAPIFAFIDSAIPTIWLPLSACQAFETAFNLTWDETAELYLVNDTLHQSLQSSNPSVNFKIGPQATGESVTIEMPYGAFDLLAEPPFAPNSSRYFPLKRAENATQYILGRAFLQNAYIIANYEHFNFSVSQATYPGSGTATQLVTLPGLGASSGSNNSSSGLSTGAIVGIAVGGAVVLILIVLAIIFFMRRKRRQQRAKPVELEGPSAAAGHQVGDRKEIDGQDGQLHEVAGADSRYEMDSANKPYEIGANDKGYVQKPMEPVELPAEIAAAEVHSQSSTPFVTPLATPGGLSAFPGSPLSPAEQQAQTRHRQFSF